MEAALEEAEKSSKQALQGRWSGNGRLTSEGFRILVTMIMPNNRLGWPDGVRQVAGANSANLVLCARGIGDACE